MGAKKLYLKNTQHFGHAVIGTETRVEINGFGSSNGKKIVKTRLKAEFFVEFVQIDKKSLLFILQDGKI